MPVTQCQSPRMPFKIVILWTDALVFLLIAAVLALIWHVRRHEHLAASWRKVARSASGMSAATVLAFFVIIGIVDSLHYNPAVATKDGKVVYGVEVLSVLDKATERLRMRKATTYSAPLATHRYTKESIELPDGRQVRDYPRLKYGGAHLKDPEADWASDVVRRCFYGVAAGLVIWLVVATLLCALLAQRHAANTDQIGRAHV